MADWTDLLRDGPDPSDIGTAFVRGQAQAAQLQQAEIAARTARQQQQDQAAYRSRVGELLRTGDFKSASAQAYAIGDDKAGAGFAGIQKQSYDQGVAGAGAMGEVVRGITSLPYEQRSAALQAAKPMLRSMGYADQDIDVFDPTDQNLAAVGGLGYAAKDRAGDQQAAINGQTDIYRAETGRIEANNPVTVGGSLVTRGGQELYRAPEYISAPMSNNVIEVGGAGAQGYASFAPGSISAEQLYMSAIEPQESGGRAGAIGPQTRYGRAQGASQMLPDTARGVAKNLGVAWRPDLMTATTREGLEYQRRLGVGYAQEALDATGGDVTQAAMYYHGGPDRSIWGPRTRRYGQEVTGRLDRAIGQTSTTRQTRNVQTGQLSPSEQAKLNKQQGKGNDQMAEDSYDRAIRSAGDLRRHAGLRAAVGSGFDPASFGSQNPITGQPFSGTNAADFVAGLDTLKAQTFLPQVQALKGMGALSDAEGKKLTDAVGALSVNMSEQAFTKSLDQVISDLSMYRDRFRQQRGAGQAGSNQGGGGRAVNPNDARSLLSGRGSDAQFDAVYGQGAAAKVRSRYR